MDLRGKNVLLTGASSGIGRELALALGERGAVLALAARREGALNKVADEVRNEHGERPVVLSADLAVRGEAQRLASRAEEQLGPIDVLINNAGASVHGLQWVCGDRDEGRSLFELLYWSSLRLVAELVPGMRQRKLGSVVNVSSLAQGAPFPGLGHYVAAKAALSGATRTLQLELRRSGVQAIDVLFGTVDTPGSNVQHALPGGERWLKSVPKGKAATAARRVARAIERERRVVIYPGFLRSSYVFPSFARVFARYYARAVDPNDQSVRETWLAPETTVLREQWEREHYGAPLGPVTSNGTATEETVDSVTHER